MFGTRDHGAACLLCLMISAGAHWALLRGGWVDRGQRRDRPPRAGLSIPCLGPPPLRERHRPQVVLLVVLGTITNRTFLTWLSSGLETALFNFLLTSWLCLVLELRENSSTARVALLCAAVGFMGLTRPDGLLFLAATVALLALGPERPANASRTKRACEEKRRL